MSISGVVRKEKKRNHIIVPKSLKITSQNSENDGDDDSPEGGWNITTHASEGGQQHLQAPTPKGVYDENTDGRRRRMSCKNRSKGAESLQS